MENTAILRFTHWAAATLKSPGKAAPLEMPVTAATRARRQHRNKVSSLHLDPTYPRRRRCPSAHRCPPYPSCFSVLPFFCSPYLSSLFITFPSSVPLPSLLIFPSLAPHLTWPSRFPLPFPFLLLPHSLFSLSFSFRFFVFFPSPRHLFFSLLRSFGFHLLCFHSLSSVPRIKALLGGKHLTRLSV